MCFQSVTFSEKWKSQSIEIDQIQNICLFWFCFNTDVSEILQSSKFHYDEKPKFVYWVQIFCFKFINWLFWKCFTCIIWPLFNSSNYFEICQSLKVALKITKNLQGRQFQLLSSEQGVQFIEFIYYTYIFLGIKKRVMWKRHVSGTVVKCICTSNVNLNMYVFGT